MTSSAAMGGAEGPPPTGVLAQAGATYDPAAPTRVHRLHPVGKVAGGLMLTLAAMGLTAPPALAILLGLPMGLLLLGRVRPPARVVAVLAGALLLAGGGNLLVAREPTHAAMYTLRLLVLLSAVPAVAAVTPAARLFRALGQLRLPSGLVFGLAVAFRFFPILTARQRSVREADALRGHARTLGWYRRVVVPLAFFTVDHAERVAIAAELRGFSPSSRRTRHRAVVWGGADLAHAAVVMAIVAAAIWLELHT